MNIISLAVSVCVAASAATAWAASQVLQLDGRFEHRTDAESLSILGNQVCFHPSEKSAASLPRAPADKRLAWFCFSDTESAARQLRIPLQAVAGTCGTAGTASVEVESYKVYAGEGEGNDVASLRLVRKQSTPLPLACTP